MKKIGEYTEQQVRAGVDKADCERATAESGGRIKYFTVKFKRKKGQDIMVVFGMGINEYLRTDEI